MIRCDKCQFYTADTAVIDGVPDSLALGTCRRYPPVFIRLIDVLDIEHNEWRQSVVSANDWCGEFKGFTTEGGG